MIGYEKGKLEISKIYRETNLGLDIITDIYPDALAAALAGGSFHAGNDGSNVRAWLTKNGGVWYVQYGNGDPMSPVRLYMRHHNVGIEEAIQQLHDRYIASAAPVAEEGGER